MTLGKMFFGGCATEGRRIVLALGSSRVIPQSRDHNHNLLPLTSCITITLAKLYGHARGKTPYNSLSPRSTRLFVVVSQNMGTPI